MDELSFKIKLALPAERVYNKKYRHKQVPVKRGFVSLWPNNSLAFAWDFTRLIIKETL